MRKIISRVVLAGFLAGSINNLSATTTNVYLQTYFVLTGMKQSGGQAVSIRIINKDVLAALNATGNFNFGTGAQLLLKSFDDQLPIFVVQETNGSQITKTDVSSFLSLTEPVEVDTQSKMTSYAIRVFTLDNQNGTSFSVTGFTTMYRGTITSATIGPLTRVYNASSQVSGPGSLSGNDAALHGNIYAGFAKAERDP